MSVEDVPRFSLIQIVVLSVITSVLSVLFYKLTGPKKDTPSNLNVSEFELLEVYMDNGSKQYFLGETDPKTKETFWFSNPVRKVNSCTEKGISKYFKNVE